MPEIGSSDNDRNVDSADIQSQVEFSGHGQNDPPIFPPLYQTEFTELSITKHLVGNLETIFTEQE